MQSKATTVEQYLASLPEDRRAALSVVREVFRKNLDRQYREGMQYGMIGYYVPHEVYPAGYHCDPKQPLPFAGLASQKGHMSMYLMGVYIDTREADGETAESKRFRAEWAKTGKKLDMGKACIRFKRVEDLALDVLAAAIRRLPVKTYVRRYEGVLATSAARPKSKPAPKAKDASARGTSKTRTKPVAAAKRPAKAPAARAKTARKR